MKTKLLEHIREEPGTYAAQAAKELGHDRQTVSKYAKLLEAEGKVRMTRKGQIKEYYPLEEGDGD